MNKRLRSPRVAALAAIMLFFRPAFANDSADGLLTAVAQADLKLEWTNFRLSIANADSCPSRAPGTGIIIRSLREYAPEYRSAVRDHLGSAAPVLIEAIVPGSPAEQAGLAPGDGLVAVEGKPAPALFPGPQAPSDLRDLDAANRLFDTLPPSAPIHIQVRRHDTLMALRIYARPQCRAHTALVLGPDLISDTDGTTIRIGSRFVERLDDDGLAVIVAHELAHIILGHPAERERLGLKSGIAGEFGKSARITLEQEDAADLLSVHLLARAGFNPTLVARFWRGRGRAILGVLPRGPSHRGWQGRAERTEAEADRIRR